MHIRSISRLFWVGWLLVFPYKALAISPAAAEACEQKIIDGYNQKQAPLEIFALERIARKAIGRNYNQFTPETKAVVIQVVRERINEAFTWEGYGLTREQTRPNVNASSVTTLVTITTPDGTYPGTELEALLVAGAECLIWEIKIGVLFRLSNGIRRTLEDDVRTQHMLREER